MTIPVFKANNAGINCILASHPNHVCKVPEKSRNNNVIKEKQIVAKIILRLRNMIAVGLWISFLLNDYLKSERESVE